jgi:hypothetical protein
VELQVVARQDRRAAQRGLHLFLPAISPSSPNLQMRGTLPAMPALRRPRRGDLAKRCREMGVVRESAQRGQGVTFARVC